MPPTSPQARCADICDTSRSICFLHVLLNVMPRLLPSPSAFALTRRQDGRLFAIFVSASGASWETDKAELIKIRDSFQVYDLTE
jgi:hypothetical protein